MDEKFKSGVSGEKLFYKFKGLSYSDVIILDTIYSQIEKEDIRF